MELNLLNNSYQTPIFISYYRMKMVPPKEFKSYPHTCEVQWKPSRGCHFMASAESMPSVIKK